MEALSRSAVIPPHFQTIHNFDFSFTIYSLRHYNAHTAYKYYYQLRFPYIKKPN